jgi:hypothetical protein
MPDIFTSGSTGTDARALDEVLHYIQLADKGNGVPETQIVNFARQRIPITALWRVIETMIGSGMITSSGVDRLGQRWFKANSTKATDPHEL